MAPRDVLADFQAALLDLLSADLPVDEIVRRLRSDEAFVEFRDYVTQIEPRMLAIAVELVKKWGKRNSGESARHGME